MGWIILM